LLGIPKRLFCVVTPIENKLYIPHKLNITQPNEDINVIFLLILDRLKKLHDRIAIIICKTKIVDMDITVECNVFGASINCTILKSTILNKTRIIAK